jgi:nicotinamide-nucleotide amidase
MGIINGQSDIDAFDAILVKVRSVLGDAIYAEEDITLAEAVGRWLLERKATLSVAESCTGGFLGHLITSIPGSSAYFQGGAITYSNALKESVLGVRSETLARHGAVSKETARQMAEGARRTFKTDYAISVTGVAGPDGGSPEKPVGTVWIAVASDKHTIARKWKFTKKRAINIELSAMYALNMLRKDLMPNQ